MAKIPTEITLENDTLDLKVNDIVEIIANLTPADAGEITYTSSDDGIVMADDGVVVATGKGTAVITLSFAGNDRYAASENKTIAVTVTLWDAQVSVGNDTLDLMVDDRFDLNASTLPASLSVEYSSDNESVATVNQYGIVTAVGEGTAVITLSVGDDKVYALNSTTVTVNVAKIPTEIALENESLELKVNDEADAGASLTPQEAGNLTYRSNDTSVVKVKNGKIIALKEGTAKITVSFKGNDKYAKAKNKIIEVTVSLRDATVKADPESLELVIGEEGEIFPTTDPEFLDVSFTSSNESVATVKNTHGYGLVTAVGEGTAIITVTINEKAFTNSSTTVTVTVKSKVTPKENATMNLTASEITEGEDAVINVELPEDATGNVSAADVTAEVKDGKATLTIPGLAKGNYTIPVTYSGDEKYNPVTEDANVSVKENTTITVSAPDIEKYFGGNESFVVTVYDYKGNPIEGKEVTIVINGQTIKRTTKSDGTAKVAINLNSGIYNATTTVDDIAVTSKITVKSTVNATDLTKVFRNGTQFYATFLDSQGNYLPEGTMVQFNINGVLYDRTVKANGLAKLNINIEQGTYIITSMNPVTGENAANNITVISRLVENHDIVKIYGNGTHYTLKVLGDDGNPIAAEEVTFNVNGVFYTRTSNESGMVKMHINLEPGEYIITAEYMGCRVSNNITVLSRIVENHDITKYYKNDTHYTLKVLGDDGNPASGEIVTFNVNGVFYTRISNESGMVKMHINLHPGDYIITAENRGCRVSNNITVLPVLSAEDLTKKYGTSDQFVAHLLDGQGNPYGDQKISFNVNGVLYYRYTSSGGDAKLNINLMPGEYIITSGYDGTNIANTIKVTA